MEIEEKRKEKLKLRSFKTVSEKYGNFLHTCVLLYLYDMIDQAREKT